MNIPGRDFFRKPQMAAKPAPNPRKPATGTSYTATGAVPPNTDNEMGSSMPVAIREIVPELLTASQRLQTYGKMMNDTGVNISITAGKTPVLGAEFYIDAHSPDPNDELIGQFIHANLFEGMSSPFINSLSDILEMYVDGFSILEKNYELREWSPSAKGSNSKKYTMLKKFGYRPGSTIKEITYDNNGGPKTVVQAALQADKTVKDVPLDISKIMIFTFQRRGGDLTGKSMLRTAHQHWFYKTHFYKIDAIQKERHGIGVPKGRLLAGYTPADKIAMRKLLRNLRTNEEAFMLLTPNVEVEFAEFKGMLVNVLESATHHNSMILLNVLAQFLALGLETSGGGRATAGSQVDIYMKAFRYVANYICDVINMYVIPELVVYNFKTTNFPKLKVRNIGETRDLQQIGSAISGLIHEGAITVDDDTEQWIRRTFDMPGLKTLGLDRTKPGATATDPTQNGNAGNGNKNGVKPTRQTGNAPADVGSGQ